MLELRNIGVRFGGLQAVDGVALSVAAGEIVGLVGPNGAGKTTLFNVISGTVRPQRGSVHFGGVAVARMPAYARARHGIGRTFQIPQPMHTLTVMENLTVAQRYGTGKMDRRVVAEILDLVQLADHASRDAATELSLTELKALEVAKALATQPRILLLDEVLAGLEANGKRKFTQLLADIHARFKLAILIIEHDIETICTLCPRVAVLNFGQLIADGTPEFVFSQPDVVASYTGTVSHA
jgi:branched-chain amino acid transport system ATP-binding protein